MIILHHINEENYSEAIYNLEHVHFLIFFNFTFKFE